MKKKKIVILIVVLLLAAAAAVYFFVFRDKDSAGSSKKKAYVEKVSVLTDSGIGGQTRFMGIVESQATKGIERDTTKKIKERFVEIGDKVKEGDQLFAYDTEDIQLELQSMELELNNMRTNISSDNAALQDLRNQKAEAKTEDDRLLITANINTLVASINQQNYDLEVKLLEYDRKKASLEMNVVTSPMNGVVKAINETEQSNNEGNNNQNNAYITIMEEGDFRVKGILTEEALSSLNSGQEVYLISRIDENKYWTGKIDKINHEPATSSENGYGSSGEKSSQYTFYVTPDNSEGLVLGQHLYIELNVGQQLGEKAEGVLKLPAYYMIEENGEHYVWMQDSKNRLKKQKLTLGEYDEGMDAYEIVDGLTIDDYIAFPEDRLEEGMRTTSNYDEYIESVQKENEENGGDENEPADIDEGGDVEETPQEGEAKPFEIDETVYSADDPNLIYDIDSKRYFTQDGNELIVDDNGELITVDNYERRHAGDSNDGDTGVIDEPATIEE